MEPNNSTSKTWNDNYALGIPEIDYQHQKFFDIYDKIQDIIANEKCMDNSMRKKIVEELKDYLKTHFYTEENLMIKAGYENVEEHVKQHEFFIRKIDEFMMSIQYQKQMLLTEMLVFIKKWFLTHIMQTDSKYYKDVFDYLGNKQNF